MFEFCCAVVYSIWADCKSESVSAVSAFAAAPCSNSHYETQAAARQALVAHDGIF
jgi:hypothetical protein